jgi:hypothetical protein
MIKLVFDVRIRIAGIQIVLPAVLLIKLQKQILSHIGIHILKPVSPDSSRVEQRPD